MNFFDLFKDILGPECIFRVNWEIYCPGCGGTRALLALMQGEIIQSIKYNPITFLFLIDVFLMTVLHIIEKRKPDCSTAKFRIVVNSCFLIFIVLFFLARNLLLYAFGIDVLGDFR